MDRVLIGTDARWFLEDVELLFGEGVGEPILVGIDLAPGPELVSRPLDKPLCEMVELPDVKRTHPTTARELRRAERRRYRRTYFYVDHCGGSIRRGDVVPRLSDGLIPAKSGCDTRSPRCVIDRWR